MMASHELLPGWARRQASALSCRAGAGHSGHSGASGEETHGHWQAPRRRPPPLLELCVRAVAASLPRYVPTGFRPGVSRYMVGPFNRVPGRLVGRILHAGFGHGTLSRAEAELLFHCELRELDLAPCAAFVTNRVLDLVGHQRDLELLDLRGCGKASSARVEALLGSSINPTVLAHLDLRGLRLGLDRVCAALSACSALCFLALETSDTLSEHQARSLCRGALSGPTAELRAQFASAGPGAVAVLTAGAGPRLQCLELGLDWGADQACCIAFEGLGTLLDLTLSNVLLAPSSWRQLLGGATRNLTSLRLAFAGNPGLALAQNTGQSAALPRLQALTLRDLELREGHLLPLLTHTPGLQHLELAGVEFVVDDLAQSPAPLETLRVSECSISAFDSDGEDGDVGAEAEDPGSSSGGRRAGLARLRHCWAGKCSDESLWSLLAGVPFPALCTLALPGCDLQPDSFADILGAHETVEQALMPELRGVDLSRSNVAIEHIAALLSCEARPHVGCLDLSGCRRIYPNEVRELRTEHPGLRVAFELLEPEPSE